MGHGKKNDVNGHVGPAGLEEDFRTELDDLLNGNESNYETEVAIRADNIKLAYYGLEFMARWMVAVSALMTAEHFDELEEHWTLQDDIGNNHRVAFNKSITMLMLTFGWDEFRDFYHIKMKPLISFTYLGNSVFQTKIFEGSTTRMNIHHTIGYLLALLET
ncbi:hypothetical protein MTR_8g468550 [Medicago truncatula]|uniref:Uncharacterized protein n=1 Tax=Medicago truncatula TaxID=3880 RepID=A0A072TQW1_MEDTR|nr:hypothetical protein MTR_8g468550 [Medicago truncatula]